MLPLNLKLNVTSLFFIISVKSDCLVTAYFIESGQRGRRESHTNILVHLVKLRKRIKCETFLYKYVFKWGLNHFLTAFLKSLIRIMNSNANIICIGFL